MARGAVHDTIFFLRSAVGTIWFFRHCNTETTMNGGLLSSDLLTISGLLYIDTLVILLSLLIIPNTLPATKKLPACLWSPLGHFFSFSLPLSLFFLLLLFASCGRQSTSLFCSTCSTFRGDTGGTNVSFPSCHRCNQQINRTRFLLQKLKSVPQPAKGQQATEQMRVNEFEMVTSYIPGYPN